MISRKKIIKVYLLFLLFYCFSFKIVAQNCTVNAGVNFAICETETLTLNGVLGGQTVSSLWVQTGGPSVIIQNPSNPVTNVTGVVGGNTYTFKLTALCGDSVNANDQSVSVTVNPIPTANAGPDIEGCPGTYNLQANTFDTSSGDVFGYWMVLGSNQAGVTFSDKSSPTSTIYLSDAAVGTTTMRWTIENSTTDCITEDDMTVTNFGGEPKAIAGNDRTLSNCYSTSTLVELSGSIGGDGTGNQIGVWTFVSGPNVPNIEDPNDENTLVRGLIEGVYVFRWTVTGPCASGKDEVTITVPPATQDITDAIVNRRNIRFCDPSVTTTVLKGNVPQYAGETVQWSQVGGPTLPAGSIVSPNSPTTQVINLDGSSPKIYTFRYSIIGGASNTNCISRSETKVHFNKPSVAIAINGGNDIDLPLDETVVKVPYIVSGGSRTRYEIIAAPNPSGLVPIRNAGETPLRLEFKAGPGVYTLRMIRDAEGDVLTGCNLASDEINITVSLSPTDANAGSDSVLDCGQSSTSLAGNAISVGVATWSQVSGPNTAIISDINSPNPTVTGLVPGEYVFRYVVFAGPNAPVSSSDTKVTYATPPVVDAGPDESICAGTYQLQGSALLPGQSGKWTVIPDVGISFLDDTLNNTTVSGLQKSRFYNFTWTVSTLKCGDASDVVTITTNGVESPSRADAGPDQCLTTGASSIVLTALETETPFRGNGEWTFVSGPTTPLITKTGDFTAEVTNITSDGDYEFKWTVNALFCSASTEDNMIVYIGPDTNIGIDAGPDQEVCSDSVVMDANVPAAGLSGKWEQVSGNAGWTVDNINNPKATFTNLIDGKYTFKWVVSKGSCESSEDQIDFSISEGPTPATAGPIADICNASTLTLTGNIITQGTGTWTVVSGPNNPTIVDVNDPTSEVTNLVSGRYEFKWTSRNGFNCPNSEATTTAEVVAEINLDGKDQNLCAATQVLLEANAGAIGVWTQTAPINSAVISLTTTSDNTAIAELDPLVTDTYVFTFTAGTTCTSSDSLEIKNSKLPETPNAGPDQDICTDTTRSVVMAATGEPGKWVLASGPNTPTISDANDKNATISNLVQGLYIYEWNVGSSPCTEIKDVVRINVYNTPSTADAGPDQSGGTAPCQVLPQLDAVPPTTGIGTWTLTTDPSGGFSGIIIDSPNDPKSTLTINSPFTLPLGSYEFTWTVSNGNPVCSDSVDTVILEFNEPPASDANAGPDQELCDVDSTTLFGNIVSVGTGTWTQDSGPNSAAIGNQFSAETPISGLIAGTYVFRWSITSGGCSTTDTVQVEIYDDSSISVINAGPDQTVGQYDNIFMDGEDVSPLEGKWIFKNGPSTPVIVDENDPQTQITAVIPGTYEFTWNVAFGVCPPKEDTVIITVVGVTDISVDKSVNILNPIVGSDVTYTILVENLGINNATGVVISDQLPVGISVVPGSVSNNGVVNTGNRTIEWLNLDINTSSTISLTYQATVLDPTNVANEYTNTASLQSLNEIDDNANNDQDTVILTPISVVDVVLTKEVNNSTPNEGENIFFKISVKNNSLSSITNTVITDLLPSGLTYVNATATKPNWNYPNWEIGTMQPGETEELILEVSVDQGTAGQSITNVISNTQDQVDRNLTIDDDNETIEVTSTNLVTKKSVEKQLVAEGETIWFTINVKNEGPGLATNVSLTDILPADLLYVVDAPSQGVYNNGSGEWNVGDIQFGVEASLRIFATVKAGTQGKKITNITTAAKGDQTDLITAGDDLQASVYVNSFTDIVVTKVADNPTPNVGDIVTYTISVTNAGSIKVTNFVLKDFLPVGLTHVSGNTSVGTWSNPNWSVTEIAPGVTEVLTLQARVEPRTEGQALTNTVSHQQDQLDLNLLADDMDETVNVTLSDLITVKTVDSPLTAEGDTIVYTITVTNNGNSDATNVSLVDNLPSGVTYVSDDSGGLYNNGSGIWSIGGIASGSVAVLNITATVNAGTSGTKITNTTSAAKGDQSDPGSVGDILSADVFVSNGTDIVLSKRVNNNTPNEGDTILYEISVTNNGAITVTNLVITDILDPGLVPIGGAPSEGTFTYPEWSIGTLNPGVTENLVLQVFVANGTSGQTLVNTISNSQDQFDLNITTDDLTEAITVNASDLVTVKSVDNSIPGEGDFVTYSISVKNNGPNDATRVSLIDQLPAGVTYVSDDTGGRYNAGSGIWFIGNLANGASEKINIVARVDNGTAGSTITNKTTIAVSDQTDPSGNGDQLEAPIFIDNATDIVLTKTVNNAVPNEGDRIAYTITVTNKGPIEATNVLIEDVLPSGLAYLSSFATNGTYSNPNWSISSLPVGTTETLTIDVLVLNGTSGQSLTNTIINSQDQFDSNLTADDNDETIRVSAVDLVTIKTVDNTNPAEGDSIVYTLSVTNNGLDEATNVSLFDNLPAGVSYDTDDSSGAYNTATGEWQIPSIASGSVAVLNISATVDVGTSDSFITNFTTAAQSDQSDNSTLGDILEATIHVDNETDIALTKTVNNPNPIENETIIYTISVSNNGPDEATSLKITDILPAGLTEISATPSIGSWNNSVWNIGRLAIGASASLSLSASVDSGTAGMSITNTISNTQDQLDSNITPDDTSETIVVASVDLITKKSVDNTTPKEGDTVSYTITVNNNGPNDATGVSLIDNLPNGVTYVSDDSGGTYNRGSGEWNLGDLSNGGSASLVIQATVNSGTAGTTVINKTTAAAGDQTDLNTNGDVLEAQIFIDNATDIVLSKTANNANPNEGDEVVYTITVSNRGNTLATNLVITDVLPSGLTYVSGLPSKGLWISPSWSINSLAAGDSESLNLVVRVDSGTAGQTLTNTISNTQDQLDTNTTPDDLDETIVVSSSDLVTVKSVNNSAPSVGDTIVYSITVVNNGLSDATGVSLIDNLPFGVTYVSDDSAGAFNESTGVWTLGDLANQDSKTLNITVSVDSSSAGKTIVNRTSEAIADQSDPTTVGDELEAIIYVDNKTDIVLSKVVNNEFPNEGDTVVYTIQVTNNSTVTATNLIIKDVLPVGLTYVSGTPSKGIWNNPNWSINSLSSGVTSTLLLVAKVDFGAAGQRLTNTISNTQDQLDSNATADDSDETIVVSSSDLVTVKSVDNSKPNEGELITYSIIVTNNGNSNATNVSLIDKLPVGVTYDSDDAGGDYNSTTGLWNIGDLLNGISKTLNIKATVNAGTSGKTITNTTNAALADQADPSSTGDRLSVPIYINNETDIVVTKVADNTTPNEGDRVVYTVTVENNGPNTATNLEITDILPVGLTYISAIPTTGNWNGSIWSVPNMVSGQVERIFITVSVDSGTAGQGLTNTVSNSQDQLDTNATLDDLEETIVVKAANLVTTKSVDDSTPTEGDTITYAITVTNNGPSDATSVNLIDNLPNGVTYVGDNSGGSYNNGSGEWTIGTIPNGASATLQIEAVVNSGTSGTSITNTTIAAEGLESDPTTFGDNLQATIFVNNTTDIVLTKIVDNPMPNEGDEVYFTITVENKGPVDATNLIIEDVLPTGLTYVSGIASEGIWTYPEWSLKKLEVGVAETLLIKASVDAGTSGASITNTISNTQDQFDANITVDDDIEIINVTSSDLVTVKIVNNTNPAQGEVVVYSITVTNNGPNNATNVSLEDRLPNGLTYIDDDALGNYNSGSGIWNIGDIPSNTSRTLNIKAQVAFGTSGRTITNITTAASGDQTDPTNAGDILEAPVYIDNETDIVLTKTVSSNTPNEGDEITYTITVTNKGNVVATNLLIEDLLPTGLTYISGVASFGVWSFPDWTISNLGIGATETLLVRALVASGTAGQTLTNTVSNSQDQLDTNATQDDASETITVSLSDLVTVKTVSTNTPSEGETIFYTIEVTNNGPNNATNVSLVDNLPSGVTYVSDNSAGAYNSGSGIWSLGDLSNGATSSLVIETTVDTGFSGTTVTNSTTAAAGDQADTSTAGDVLDASIFINNETDIVLTKTVNNNLPNEGDEVIYTITVSNRGNIAATNLVIEDLLPAGLTFVQGVPSEGVWLAPEWIVGTLDKGVTETLLLRVKVGSGTSGSSYTNAIRNSQDQLDINAGIDDSTEIITVSSSDLITVKTVDNVTPNEGDTINYTISVSNNGPNNATNVSLVDILPNGVTYLSDNSSGSYNRGTGIWTIGDINNGDTSSLIIQAKVDIGAAGKLITNSASAASGDQLDPSSVGDVLDATILINNETDIVLVKTVNNNFPSEGEEVIYTIIVANNGPIEATNLVIEDLLPSGLRYVQGIPSEGTWTAPSWNIGTLGAGLSETLLLRVLVDSGTAGQILTNTITNSQDQLDSNATNDDASETITVSSSDLSVEKTVDNTSPIELSTIFYTITVTNNGPNNATNVSLEDNLPDGVSYISDDSGGAYNPGSGIWTLGDLADGAVKALTIEARVNFGTSGQTIINTTSNLILDQKDTNASNNIGSVAIVPVRDADLSLVKSFVDNTGAPNYGNLKTFELIVSNSGSSIATGVEVTDLLPSGYNFVSYSSTTGVYDEVSGIWKVGTVVPGNAVVLLIEVEVLGTGDYENCAEITKMNETDSDSTPGNGDPNEDDYACASISFGSDLDLGLEKTVQGSGAGFTIGSEVTFQIELTNYGALDVKEVVVEDILPNGYTFTRYQATAGVYDSTSGFWTIDNMTKETSEVLTITAMVNSTGNYENCASIISSTNTDKDPSNDQSCASITLTDLIDLELVKIVSTSNSYALDQVDFTIQVSNEGPSAATGVTILDLLPTGYEFVSYTASAGLYDATTGIWELNSSLNAGVAETLDITVKVLPSGNWKNTAEVYTADQQDVDSTPGNGNPNEDDYDSADLDVDVRVIAPEEFTPNGDNINDTFVIQNLQIVYPNFKIVIVNRWGNKVYEYQHNGNPNKEPLWWDGISQGRMNTSNGIMPDGSYFYSIEFNNGDRKPITGWVYLRQ